MYRSKRTLDVLVQFVQFFGPRPPNLVCCTKTTKVGIHVHLIALNLRLSKHHVRLTNESLFFISTRQVLLPTYNILDGAQSLLEAHKVGRRLVGGFGVKTILPREFNGSRLDSAFMVHGIFRIFLISGGSESFLALP